MDQGGREGRRDGEDQARVADREARDLVPPAVQGAGSTVGVIDPAAGLKDIPVVGGAVVLLDPAVGPGVPADPADAPRLAVRARGGDVFLQRVAGELARGHDEPEG